MVNRRRSRKIRSALFYLFFAAFLGGSVWGIFYSSLLRIATVEVSGTEVLDASVVRAVAEEWLSGTRFLIFPKAHVFLYQPGGLVGSLRNRFLRIASLQPSVDLRTHTLQIEVRERKPMGFWCLAPENSCLLFDADGMLFEELDRPEGSGGLMIEDRSGRALALGDRAASPEWIAYMKVLADALAPDVWIKQYVVETESFAAGYLRAQTGTGWDVLLNVGPAAAKTQAENLKNLLEKEIGKNASHLEYIDLRVPGRAYYKLKTNSM